MVLLPSLTGPELPHDRVTSAMHHTVALRSKARVGKAQGQTAPPSALPSHGPPSGERLVISNSRPAHAVGDDDPTPILSRVPDGGLEPMASASGSDTARHAAAEWSEHAYPRTVEETAPFGKGRGMEHDRTLPDARSDGRMDISRDLLRQNERHRAAPSSSPPRSQQPQPPHIEERVPSRAIARAPVAPSSSPARIGLWIVVLLLAVAAGAGAAYWVIGRL